MIYYEVIDSKYKSCNGCILSSMNENRYEIILVGTKVIKTIGEKGSEFKYIKGIKILDRETQQLIVKETVPLPATKELSFYFQIVKPVCSMKSSITFCCFTGPFYCFTKEISQKEALLKIL